MFSLYFSWRYKSIDGSGRPQFLERQDHKSKVVQ